MIRVKVEVIKARAKELGLSQGALVRKAEMDEKTLKRLYKDPYAEWSSITLDKIARTLHIDASELIESVKDEEN